MLSRAFFPNLIVNLLQQVFGDDFPEIGVIHVFGEDFFILLHAVDEEPFQGFQENVAEVIQCIGCGSLTEILVGHSLFPKLMEEQFVACVKSVPKRSLIASITRFRIGSVLATLPPFSSAALASTFSLVGSRTQSSRRSTVSGRMTRPYCGGLYGPRSRSATLQMKLTLSAKFVTVLKPF